MKAIFYKIVDVRKGFRKDGRRVYEEGSVFSMRPEFPPKIEHGYIIKHPNGYEEFIPQEAADIDVANNQMLSAMSDMKTDRLLGMPIIGFNND